MSLLYVIVVLIIVGVGLWAVNTYLGAYIAKPILAIINIVIVLLVVIWVLTLFLPGLTTPIVRPVPR